MIIVLLIQIFHCFSISISIRLIIILLNIRSHLWVFLSSLFFILFLLVLICLDVWLVAFLSGFRRHIDVKHVILWVFHILIHLKQSRLIIFIVILLISSLCFPIISTHLFNTSLICLLLSKFILHFWFALNRRVAERLILPTFIFKLRRILILKLRRLFPISAV